MVKSSKQKLVSKDSTEAELIALSDMMKHVDKCNAFMSGQGIAMKTPVLCQDNTSTIALVKNGGGIWRSKYMRVRQESVKERIDLCDFGVEYVPTGEMIADILTKPLHGNLFRWMRSTGEVNRKVTRRDSIDRGAFGLVTRTEATSKSEIWLFDLGTSGDVSWNNVLEIASVSFVVNDLSWIFAWMCIGHILYNILFVWIRK